MGKSKIAVRLAGQPYIGVEVKFRTYLDPGGGVAIQLSQRDEPLATATANLAQQGYRPTKPNRVFIKDYEENAGMLESLIRAGIVQETGLVVRSGFALFPEVELLGDWAKEAERVRQEDRRRRVSMLRGVQ